MKLPRTTLECISTSNSLLLGELSAAEAYEMTISKQPATATRFHLTRIAGQHWRSVDRLTAMVCELGGKPATDSCGWGEFTSIDRFAVDLPGPKWAIYSLKRGEEQGRDDYEDALNHGGVMDHLKTLIRDELLTSIENNISLLERLQRTFA